MTTIEQQIAYYAQPGVMTDSRGCASQLAALPRELPELVRTLQTLYVHIFWLKAYGLEVSEERKNTEVNLRPIHRRLDRMLELDPAPLSQPRSLEKRLVSNCRDITLLAVSVLRAQGRPARARCGFGTYFTPGHFEDHWIVELWDEGRWRQADFQIDETMIKYLQIPFDPLDLPAGAFVTGGEAWRMCRAGQADPGNFGIFEFHGWDFVRGDLARDLLALRKVEVLPWDSWGPLATPLKDSPESTWQELDRISALTLAPETNFDALQSVVEEIWLPPANWAD